MAVSESPVVDAVQLAIDEVNQAGGVLGRPLQPIVADGKSDPQVFAAEAVEVNVADAVCRTDHGLGGDRIRQPDARGEVLVPRLHQSAIVEPERRA